MTPKINQPGLYPFKVLRVVNLRTGQVIDWGLKSTNIPDQWKETQGAGVKVAVLDTAGPGTTHKDIKIYGGANFTSSPDGDGAGHGTHVMGIIAAMNNSYGVVGVAPKAQVYAVKVLGDNGSGAYEWIAAGIEWAIENEMDIISMSLGSNYDSPVLHDAVKKAYAKNITIVCAAGNDSRDVDYPGKYEQVIAVGSTDKHKDISWYSSPGPEVDIAAPGQDIYSTHLNNQYAVLSGTSMATPFITGVLALMISKHRNSEHNNTPIDTPDQIREHLLRTADDKGEVGRDNYFGYGIVNPGELLNGLSIEDVYFV